MFIDTPARAYGRALQSFSRCCLASGSLTMKPSAKRRPYERAELRIAALDELLKSR